MKNADPIPQKMQGLLFGVFLFVLIPGLSIYYFATGQAEVTWFWVGVGLVCWYLQMVGVLIGYHRYFSHKSFETGPVMRFVLGFLGCISGQKGPIFWACHHRFHHNSCEEDHDVHSPYTYGNLKGFNLVKGFLWSHFLHLVENGPMPVEDKWVRDLLKQPEVVFLEKQATLIYYLFGLATYLLGGINGLVWGFFLPSFLSWNCVMLVNSAVHIWGARPYISKLAPNCNARNIWWLSIPMLGDNWHNNHHADMNSARAGFYWWQLDLNYCLIWCMSKVGLVWNVRQPDWKNLKDMENQDKDSEKAFLVELDKKEKGKKEQEPSLVN
ncbi:fatty acid desaturase [Aureispira sp. CCB-QB1]|uniref:acyl-CoA desaturase n=1 Tax=Aureispira sp. CCB-QB1 TaxID=1313421 RepID=UPI000695D559|nr:fatty acid desaturase [Aureispira sp. CCB-QB1]